MTLNFEKNRIRIYVMQYITNYFAKITKTIESMKKQTNTTCSHIYDMELYVKPFIIKKP